MYAEKAESSKMDTQGVQTSEGGEAAVQREKEETGKCCIECGTNGESQIKKGKEKKHSQKKEKKIGGISTKTNQKYLVRIGRKRARKRKGGKLHHSHTKEKTLKSSRSVSRKSLPKTTPRNRERGSEKPKEEPEEWNPWGNRNIDVGEVNEEEKE